MLTLWLVVAGVLSVAELVTRRRVLSPWAVGAMFAAWASTGDWPVYAQVAVFLMGSLLILAITLFVIEEPEGSPRRIKPEYLVGQMGRVLDEVTHRSGQVTVSGETWPARSEETIGTDRRIRVVEIMSGAEKDYLVVEPLSVLPRRRQGKTSA